MWYSGKIKFAENQSEQNLEHIVFSHNTPLLRKLRDVDMQYQYNKIINLKLAVAKIDGIIIKPGETFSYWKLIGKPTGDEQMNKSKKLLICILVLLLFVSCAVQSSSPQLYTSIEDSIAILSSESFDGRRPGTDGNIKTQEYLKNSLKNLGVQPYSESYYWEFPYTFYDVKNAGIEIENGKLDYEKDFQMRYATDSPLNISSVLKSEPVSGEKCVLLTEDVSKSLNRDGDVQAVILNVNTFKNLELIYEPNIKDKPLIVVEDETYINLYEQLNRDISINIDIEKQEKTENNVVGIIKADNNPNNEAIVISAHFDHLGSYKDKLYGGALDNASGVSTALETSKYLIENIKSEEMNKDIIIAFFNLEEEILMSGGSKKLAQELESKYSTVVDINIDCIGLKDGNIVVGYSDSSTANYRVVKELGIKLANSSIVTLLAEYYTSDHVNFKNGICLYSENQMDVIHSVNDTIDNLDLEKIQRISNLLGEYIIDLCSGDKLAGTSEEKSMSSPITTVIKDEEMDIGKCKVVEVDGKRRHLTEFLYHGVLEEVEKQFNYPFSKRFENIIELDEHTYMFMYIPNFTDTYEKQSDGKYIIKDVKCNITDLYVDEHELNKVYEKEVTLKDVASISIDGINVDRYNSSIIYMESDQYDKDKAIIIENPEITLIYDDYEIYYFYNELQESNYISTIIEIGDNNYICNVRCEKLTFSSEEDVKKFLENRNAIAIWETIIEIFEEN